MGGDFALNCPSHRLPHHACHFFTPQRPPICPHHMAGHGHPVFAKKTYFLPACLKSSWEMGAFKAKHRLG